MPVIRITDATWSRLKQWAVPLDDTRDDAVRKVLDAAEEHLRCPQTTVPPDRGVLVERPPSRKGERRNGVKTPEKVYRLPILEALHELGGSASVKDVLQVVEVKVKPLLNEFDYEKVPSGGDIRWRNTACWARFGLVKDGLLKSESPKGVWELSERGWQEVQRKTGTFKE
jgi:hypothetical protein